MVTSSPEAGRMAITLEQRANRTAFLFVLPALTFMTGMLLAPLWIVVEQSLTDKSGGLSIAGYRELVVSSMFQTVFVTTIEITSSAAVLSLLLAYPVALHLAKQPPSRRLLLSTLVLLPFWMSILVKSFAFLIIFGDNGIVADLLRRVGVVPVPSMMFNRFGVMIGLVHYFIPFMVFPILSSLLQRDPSLEKAAQVMGAGPFRIFFRIVLPLSIPGVMAGVLLTCVLCLGFFVTPALLGGRKDVMFANLIDFFTHQIFDWTTAASAAVVLLAFSAVFIGLLARLPGGRQLSRGAY
jgi:ABC-type spermidine/putrescine transport system permease subunit I